MLRIIRNFTSSIPKNNLKNTKSVKKIKDKYNVYLDNPDFSNSEINNWSKAFKNNSIKSKLKTKWNYFNKFKLKSK